MSHRSSTSSSRPPAPGLVRAALVALPGVRRGDGWLLRLLLAGVIGIPLASQPMKNWAANLPDWAEPVRDRLVWWDDTMDRAGLSAPYDRLHRWMQHLIARPF